eukprot:7167369-Prymnesium_polylepis.4
MKCAAVEIFCITMELDLLLPDRVDLSVVECGPYWVRLFVFKILAESIAQGHRHQGARIFVLCEYAVCNTFEAMRALERPVAGQVLPEILARLVRQEPQINLDHAEQLILISSRLAVQLEHQRMTRKVTKLTIKIDQLIPLWVQALMHHAALLEMPANESARASSRVRPIGAHCFKWVC